MVAETRFLTCSWIPTRFGRWAHDTGLDFRVLHEAPGGTYLAELKSTGGA